MPGASETREPDWLEEAGWMAATLVAGRTFGVAAIEVADIRGRSTRACGRVLEARRAAIYLASTAANLSSRALVRATGLDRKTIRHHLHRVEDDRELKPRLDALLDELTAKLQARGYGRAA